MNQLLIKGLFTRKNNDNYFSVLHYFVFTAATVLQPQACSQSVEIFRNVGDSQDSPGGVSCQTNLRRLFIQVHGYRQERKHLWYLLILSIVEHTRDTILDKTVKYHALPVTPPRKWPPPPQSQKETNGIYKQNLSQSLTHLFPLPTPPPHKNTPVPISNSPTQTRISPHRLSSCWKISWWAPCYWACFYAMSRHVTSCHVTSRHVTSLFCLLFVVFRYKVLFRGKTVSGDKSDCTMLLQEFDSEKQSFKLGNTKVNFNSGGLLFLVWDKCLFLGLDKF